MTREHRIKPEMLWKDDPAVDEARRRPGWREFHAICGQHKLYFDHIERDGKRGSYKATAFTVERRRSHYVNLHVADGSGMSPIDALVDAYRNAGRPVAEAELARLINGDPVIDFDELLGGAEPVDEMEDILG